MNKTVKYETRDEIMDQAQRKVKINISSHDIRHFDKIATSYVVRDCIYVHIRRCAYYYDRYLGNKNHD